MKVFFAFVGVGKFSLRSSKLRKMNQSAIYILFLFCLCWGLYTQSKSTTSVTHGSGSEKLETRAASFDQYRAQAKPLDFRKAMLKQISTGQLVYFEGRVAQAIDRSFFLVSTKKSPAINSYFENDVIVRCPQRCDLITGDVARFAARYNGITTYTTVLGGIVEAPEFFGDHFVLSSEAN